MSGRIRTVKPELLEDAITAGLSDTAFRLFIACILLADDYGNFRGETAYLKGQVYWRTAPLADIDAAVAELGSLIAFYDSRAQRYGHIKNWKKHQKVSHPGRPRVPRPPDALERDSGDSRESSGDSPEDLRNDLRSPIPIPITDHERERSETRSLGDEDPEIHESRVTRRAFPAAAPASSVDVAPGEADVSSDGRMPTATPARAVAPPSAPPAPPSEPDDGVTEFNVGDPAPSVTMVRPKSRISLKDQRRSSERAAIKAGFERGIFAATGRRHVVSEKLAWDLYAAIDGFSPGPRAEHDEQWAEQMGEVYGNVAPTIETQFSRRPIHATGFLSWLNDGMPGWSPGSDRDEPTHTKSDDPPPMTHEERVAAAEALEEFLRTGVRSA